MKYRLLAASGLLLLSIRGQVFGAGAGQALPIKNGRPAVATVNRDVIALDELVMQLGPAADRSRLQEGRGTAEDVELLDRLVNIKLIAQEAARMGLDQVPEIRKQVEVTSRQILRDVLVERLNKDLRPDPAAVEKAFRESVREWKTASLLFKDQAAAGRAQKDIAGGAAFADVSGKAAAAKAAKSDSDNAYHPKKDYLPPIAEALSRLRVGQVSPVIRLDAGFVVVKVLDIRYPENPQARAEARKSVLAQQRQTTEDVHVQALKRQYAVINNAVLKSIDYEAAKPGVNALLTDKRVVAEIKGAPSVTVSDLTDFLRLQFFHGTDQTAQRTRMNSKKEDALNATLGRRLLNMEALKLGIDKTSTYRDRVRGYEESLVFDNFIQKVIVPGNKMKEDDVKRYYGGHLKEYSNPEMMKVRGLAFSKRPAAEHVMRKLREGADYGWLAANAEGQVDKGAQGLVTFDGRPVTTTSMPEALQKTLSGSKAGEYRLYASPEGHFYVLAVQQVISSNAKPYDEVREEIAKKLYGEKLKKSIDEYVGKLRAQSKVETYVKRVR